MKFSGSYLDVPELHHLSQEERSRLYQKHRFVIFRHWRGYLGMALFYASGMIGAQIFGMLGAMIGAKWLYYIGGMIGGGFGGLISHEIAMPAILRCMLQDRDREKP